MLKVVFFARLKEQLNCNHINIQWDALTKHFADQSDNVTVEDLQQYLITLHPHWQQPLSADYLICAVNQQVTSLKKQLSPEDEVAFFPPVTGG